MCFPLPLSLTTCPLLPQKVAPAAEMKIHPWNRTLTNHMPKWGGWLSCKRSAYNLSLSGCEWRGETLTLGLLSPMRATEQLEWGAGSWGAGLAPAAFMQSAWPSLLTGAWLTRSTFLDRLSQFRAEPWGMRASPRWASAVSPTRYHCLHSMDPHLGGTEKS